MRKLRIVDLSHFNTVTDPQAVKDAGIIGVIHKATDGTSFVDPMYEARKQAFAGLGWASYHFLRARNAAAQMAHYLSVVKSCAHEQLVIDFERGNPSPSLSDLQEAVNYLRSHAPNNPITIYGGALLKEQVGDRSVMWLEETSLWVAQYTTADAPNWTRQTWPEWRLWQYSDGNVGGDPHTVPGIRQCDCSEFNGSDDECRAWFGASDPSIAPTAPPAPNMTVLKFGSSGPAVRQLQADLVKSGSQIVIDGDFGYATTKALKLFQEQHGLRPDGIAGPITMKALQAAIQEK